jgi:hypothetical protein
MVRRSRSLMDLIWPLTLLGALAVLWLPSTTLADTTPEPVDPGSLVITEIMYHSPTELDFPLGQWFEIYNASDEDLTLSGLIIEVVADEKQEEQTYALETGTAPVIPAHAFLVLGASKAQALNGGVPVGYAYGANFVLPKQGGVLRLLADNEMVDEVYYGPGVGLAAPAGSSLNLEPEGMTHIANDHSEFWCASNLPVAETKPLVMGTPGTIGHTCDSDGDGFDEAMGDCNDADAKVSPGAQEKCNGIDDDCNGSIDEEPLMDVPAWGDLGVCKQGGPVCLGESGWSTELPEAWQESETLCDSLDNDCDGEVDEGLRNACGHCGAPLPDLCDGQDNDCDGEVDEDALEPPADFFCPGDGIGVCKETLAVCDGDAGWTCLYAESFETEEVTCDGLDNNCDGDVDEGFGVGIACAIGEGVCRNQGQMVCTPDGLDVMCVGDAVLGLVELCGDDQDNDCDGLTDEGFPVGDTCEVGIGACRVTGKFFCAADRLAVECSVYPLEPIQEICGNFLDDDCDGEVDEAACSQEVVDPVGQGCGVATPGTSALTFLLLLFMPVLAIRSRRRSGGQTVGLRH